MICEKCKQEFDVTPEFAMEEDCVDCRTLPEKTKFALQKHGD